MLHVKDWTTDIDAETLVADVRAVAAEAAKRADEIDRERKFPSDLFDAVERSGAFRMLAPKKYGGLELTLKDMNDAVREGARGNGSLGWLLMVGTAQSVGNGLFEEETVRKNFEEFPDIRIRGVIAPKGQAVAVEGGWRISGRWPFASGGPNPDFIGGNCFVFEDGKPKMDAEGNPEMLLALVPADQATFFDNWHTLGMRGTDSCDVEIKDAFVPSSRAYNLHDIQTCYDTPACRLPLRVALSFPHCALALGIAQGALDDGTVLAMTKTSSMNPRAKLCEDVMFQHELGRMTMRFDAAMAVLDKFSENCWQAGVDQRQLEPKEVLEARLMANYITDECVKIVDWAYTVMGSTSVYETCQLGRRLRDIHICTQHASCFADPYRNLGRVMLGETLTAHELF